MQTTQKGAGPHDARLPVHEPTHGAGAGSNAGGARRRAGRGRPSADALARAPPGVAGADDVLLLAGAPLGGPGVSPGSRGRGPGRRLPARRHAAGRARRRRGRRAAGAGHGAVALLKPPPDLPHGAVALLAEAAAAGRRHPRQVRLAARPAVLPPLAAGGAGRRADPVEPGLRAVHENQRGGRSAGEGLAGLRAAGPAGPLRALRAVDEPEHEPQGVEDDAVILAPAARGRAGAASRGRRVCSLGRPNRLACAACRPPSGCGSPCDGGHPGARALHLPL